MSIKDACTVLSPKAFAKIGEQYGDNLNILVAEAYRPGTELYKISRPHSFDAGLILFPKEGFDIKYLFTVLSCDVAVSMLLLGENSKVKKITVKALSNMKIAKLDTKQQTAIGFLGDMNQDLMKFIFTGDLRPYLDFQQKQISELIDSIYLETLLPSILKEYKIDILNNWVQMYEEVAEIKKSSTAEQSYRAIFESFLNPSNPVINNMKKLRVVLDIILRQMPK